VGLLLATPEYKAARSCALFAGLPDELPTHSLFEAARASGRQCALPRIRADEALEFAFVAQWEDLRAGRYGVAEPPPGAVSAPLRSLGLIVVPGLAFDSAGRRLGRGKGYYDRALSIAATASGSRPSVFGWAEDWRLVDEVPSGAGDEQVDAIVTELRVVRAAVAEDGAEAEP
jgi:5-formyltetrahydrofolate cyclo-ligase